VEVGEGNAQVEKRRVEQLKTRFFFRTEGGGRFTLG